MEGLLIGFAGVCVAIVGSMALIGLGSVLYFAVACLISFTGLKLALLIIFFILLALILLARNINVKARKAYEQRSALRQEAWRKQDEELEAQRQEREEAYKRRQRLLPPDFDSGSQK